MLPFCDPVKSVLWIEPEEENEWEAKTSYHNLPFYVCVLLGPWTPDPPQPSQAVRSRRHDSS